MEPTVAPVVNIEFAGERRALRFGFLAYKALNLNPFDPASVEAFKGRAMDVDVVASVVRAGLLHEYFGKAATRKGQTPPTVDDVVAELDMFTFVPIWSEIERAMGTDADAKETQPANPPTA